MTRVLVPLLSLTPSSPSGVAFVRFLLPALARRLGPRRMTILCDPVVAEILGDVPAEMDVRSVRDRRPARILATRRALPDAVRRHRPDALYVPDNQVIGAPVDVPAVIALHYHLNWSRTAETSLARRLYWRLFYNGAVRATARRAHALLAPTAAFAEEFARFVPEAAGKLHVVHHGVAPLFAAEGPAEPEGGARPVLAVANRFAYKNLAGAVRIADRAFAPGEGRLDVAGLDAAAVEAVLNAAGVPRPARRRVRALGRLQPAELAARYRGAAALLFPSWVESFGLPVVEAMACGCPVLASNLPALSEVGGDAAILCPVGDEGAFAEALVRLLEDPAERARRVESGVRRAGEFSWERAAEKTAEALERAAARRLA